MRGEFGAGGAPRPRPVEDLVDLSGLVAQLPGADVLLTDPATMERYRRDQAAWAPSAMPLAVARPRDAEQVAAVVRWCLTHAVPVVPRGAGTGQSGGANALNGSIVVSLEAMTGICRIDPVERVAVVQPGVVIGDLRRACAEHGLWYPPDPSSAWSTIGGNVATNAGGVCCLKYGVTGDYVLALEIVTGAGELVRIAGGGARGAAGYDLVSLLIGSEGTLGVITEITLRLRPAPPPARTVVGYFDSLEAAGQAVTAVDRVGVLPAALELLDRPALSAMGDAAPGDGVQAVLLARLDGTGSSGSAEADAVLACFASAGAGRARSSRDPAEAEELFARRQLVHPALARRGTVLTEDVCVPVPRVATMLARVHAVAAEHDVQIATVTHAGHGILHPMIVVPSGDEEAVRARAAADAVVAAALDCGGSVTAEHGIGLAKRDDLAAAVSPTVLDLHRAVRNALDPYGVLNPGKFVV